MIMGKEKIKISEERKDLIYSYGQKEIFLGIRPEDIVLDAGKAGQMIQGKILVIEQLGRERLVHMQMGESRLTAFSHQTDLKPGHWINIALDMDKLHFFNKK